MLAGDSLVVSLWHPRDKICKPVNPRSERHSKRQEVIIGPGWQRGKLLLPHECPKNLDSGTEQSSKYIHRSVEADGDRLRGSQDLRQVEVNCNVVRLFVGNKLNEEVDDGFGHPVRKGDGKHNDDDSSEGHLVILRVDFLISCDDVVPLVYVML